MPRPLADFVGLVDRSEWLAELKTVFGLVPWITIFLTDNIHGLKHGAEVTGMCLELELKLTHFEKHEFALNSCAISQDEPTLHARGAMSIAAMLHDIGRFNDRGEVVAKEQITHHIRSAGRAERFCDRHGLMPLGRLSRTPFLAMTGTYARNGAAQNHDRQISSGGRPSPLV